MEIPVFVSTAWLADRLGDAAVAVVDVRPPFFYAQAHLPGAVSLPIFLFSDPSGPPPAASFRERLGQLGISAETRVVACDDGASPMAARLFWVLQAIGHRRCSILDGGITRWMHEGRETETPPTERARTVYGSQPIDPSVRLDMGAMREIVNRREALILDVRSPAEYLGYQATAARNGHIPGAINVEWSTALGESEGLPALEDDSFLRSLYEGAGVTFNRPVVVYCQSGARASHTFAVLKHLGFANVATYSAGWQEWGNTPHLPVEE